MTLQCRASGCATNIAAPALMCRDHWRMVPYALQKEVWNNYSAKFRSAAYVRAATAAIASVARTEE